MVADTLRADALGAYGAPPGSTPHLDAMAAEGAVFDRAYAPSPWTLPSLATILTGTQPSEHGVWRLTDVGGSRRPLLAEMLAAEGYATAAIVSSVLAGPQWGFDRGFGHFDMELAAGGNRGITGAGAASKAEALIASLPEPFFLMVHLFDPHLSYERHPGESFTEAAYRGTLRGGEEIADLRARMDGLDESDRAFLRGLYRGEVASVDRAVGRIRAALGKRNPGGGAALVLTADHGEEILERGWLGHTRTLFDELVRVPLIIEGPGAGGGVRREAPVSLDMVTPLVMGWARPQGTATGPPDAGPVPLTVDFEPVRTDAAAVAKRTRMRGVVEGRWKLIVDERSGTTALYDLHADPGETRDQAAQNAALVHRLISVLPELPDRGDG